MLVETDPFQERIDLPERNIQKPREILQVVIYAHPLIDAADVRDDADLFSATGREDLRAVSRRSTLDKQTNAPSRRFCRELLEDRFRANKVPNLFSAFPWNSTSKRASTWYEDEFTYHP